jgi:uncharacterized protein (DUF433 family)
MDADYGRNLDHDGAPTKAFEPSLFVWATVMSRPTDDRAIVDAGLKALAFDSGPPLVCDEPAATHERASDEHGRLGISGATNRLQIGDKIRLVPGHCDPTVNLYDWYVGIPRQPRRTALADHRPRRGLLIRPRLSLWHSESRVERSMMQIEQIVHRDPDILGGTPVFRGTRVPIRSLFDYLEGGDTLDEFLRQFPSVQRQQAVALLDLAREALAADAPAA